jgi:hypothetical protein
VSGTHHTGHVSDGPDLSPCQRKNGTMYRFATRGSPGCIMRSAGTFVHYVCKEVKLTPEQSVKSQKGIRGIVLLFLSLRSYTGTEWLTPRPGHFTAGKETRNPLHRRLDQPQGRSGQVRKTFIPSGFDPRTVRPVASRYTVYTIPAYRLDL